MRKIFLALALLAAMLPIPAPSAAGVSYVNSWMGETNATTSVSATVAPTQGDLVVALLYTYNQNGCPTVTIPGGWTVQGTPVCTSSRNESYVITHTAGASETSYSFTMSSSSYANLHVYDLGNARLDAPTESVTYAAMTSATSVQAPNGTALQPGDLTLSMFGNAYAGVTSFTGGWTTNTNGGGAYTYATSGYEAQAQSGTVTGPTATYGTAPTSGQALTVVIAPAFAPSGFAFSGAGGFHESIPVSLPSPTTVEKIVPLHAYVATSTVAGAGYDPGPTVDQAVLYEAQFTWGDTGSEDATVRSTDCPTNASCHPVGYVDMMLSDCGDSIEDAWYSQAYSSSDVGEFTHTQGASPYSGSNRYYWTTGGQCTATGGTSGGSDDIPINPANSTSNAWWLANFFQSASYINSDSHVWTMADDYSYIRHSSASSIGTAYAQEDEYAQASGHGPSVWRGAQATQLNYMSPYKLVANSLGPGSGVYQGNNKCTASSCPVGSSGTYLDGIYNWTVDTADLCSSLGSNTQSLVHEKPFAYVSGSTLVGEVYNTKIVENTDSQAWANCPSQNIEWLDFTGISGNDSPALRYVTKAMEGLAEPNSFDGKRSSRQIVQWQYTQSINSNTQLGVMPENYVVFANPTGFGATVHAFKWGSTGSNGTDDANGCTTGASPSSGGMVDVTIQATCGNDGTDSAGYNAGVQAREFSDCYVAGVDKGKCAVVLNTGTLTVANSYLSAALTNWASYQHIWQYSGTGPMNIDPITGGTVCPSGNGCNGAIGTPVAIPSGGIPACSWSNMVTSNVCAWILTSW